MADESGFIKDQTNGPLISVIVAAYNAEIYIETAIKSIIRQDYRNIEIIVVNDGSTDCTEDKIKAIPDPRLRHFSQPNRGVSAARNLGLEHAHGDYFCFLDADDAMPPASLTTRLAVFEQNPLLEFVTGAQEQRDMSMSKVLRIQTPAFWGRARDGLTALNPDCFINCGTWLIKRKQDKVYQFRTDMTHCEDLVFFLSISGDGLIGCTSAIAQVYRQTPTSAMNNLVGLAEGYFTFYRIVADNFDLPLWKLLKLKSKLALIILRSFRGRGLWTDAIVYFFKMLRA